MKKIIVTLSAVALAVSGLSGCANMNETQRDTGMGAAIGAVAGGLIGAATAGGNKGKSAATGAAIGAALGAGGGYLWSQNMQKQRAEAEERARSSPDAEDALAAEPPAGPPKAKKPFLSRLFGGSKADREAAAIADPFQLGCRKRGERGGRCGPGT